MGDGNLDELGLAGVEWAAGEVYDGRHSVLRKTSEQLGELITSEQLGELVYMSGPQTSTPRCGPLRCRRLGWCLRTRLFRHDCV